MKKLFAVILLSISTAHAASIKNKDLLEACQDDGPAGQNFCYGFIVSAANAAQYYRNLVDIEQKYLNICFPGNITNKDLVSTYTNWVMENPSVFERPAFVGVSTALSIAYSCESEK